LGFKGSGHGVRGFSDGDGEYAIVGIEVVKIASDAQDAALALYVASEGIFYRSVFERGSEDGASGISHARESLHAFWSNLRHVGRL
jgi:hypothetical protein